MADLNNDTLSKATKRISQMANQIQSQDILSQLQPVETKSLASSHLVISKYANGCGHIHLNRPKALNSLTLEMFYDMLKVLDQWKNDSSVHCVVVTGEGRAFSAGGDLKQFVSEEGRKAFAQAEYALDCVIHYYNKPYVSLIHGIVMGGGAGVSINGKYRVANENIVFSMPECSIGYFTDVGAGHFFTAYPPGEVGTFLALTAHRANAVDSLYAGIITHYVPAAKWGDLKAAFFQGELKNGFASVDDILKKFHQKPEGVSYLAIHQEAIDRCFDSSRMEDIIRNLEQEQTEWATQTAQTLRKMCPASLKVVLKQLRKAKTMAMHEIMKMELRIGVRMVERYDISEGVRAVLIDKDNKPQWDPPTLEAVTNEIVDACFAPFKDEKDELQFVPPNC